MLLRWHEKYLGIPFKPGGRTEDGCDCGGLVYLVLKNETGFAPADKGGEFGRRNLVTAGGKESIHRMLMDCLKTDWRLLGSGERPKPFDCVLYRWRGAVCHCALVVDETHVMHVECGHDSHLDRMDIPGYEIVGVYRHEKGK